MNLKIGDYAVHISAKWDGSEIADKESTMALLNFLSICCSEAADHYLEKHPSYICHHSAFVRVYVKVGKMKIEEYNGKFGVGFKLIYHNYSPCFYVIKEDVQ